MGVKRRFKTKAVTGEALDRLIGEPSRLGVREQMARVEEFLQSYTGHRVLLLNGLEGSGKTTLMLQAIARLEPEQRRRAAYIPIEPSRSFADLCADLEKLHAMGFCYIFIDNATLLPELGARASALSKTFAAQGMRLVIAGDGSLALWISSRKSLLDRAFLIPMTFIPFREYAALSDGYSFTDYLERGGTFSPWIYRDRAKAQRYIKNAVVSNIASSVAANPESTHFASLRALLQKGTLEQTIVLFLEAFSRQSTISALSRLGYSQRASGGATLLSNHDRRVIDGILERLHYAQSEPCTIDHAVCIDLCRSLQKIDLAASTISFDAGTSCESVRMLLTHPGLLFAMGKEPLLSLRRDRRLSATAQAQQDRVMGALLDAIRIRITEELILLEITRAFEHKYAVFRLRFRSGKFVVVAHDRQDRACAVFRIGHGCEPDPLLPENLALIEAKYGRILGRYILGWGEDRLLPNGVAHRNITRFLLDIRSFSVGGR